MGTPLRSLIKDKKYIFWDARHEVQCTIDHYLFSVKVAVNINKEVYIFLF